jgi:hypothetical protein
MEGSHMTKNTASGNVTRPWMTFWWFFPWTGERTHDHLSWFSFVLYHFTIEQEWPSWLFGIWCFGVWHFGSWPILLVTSNHVNVNFGSKEWSFHNFIQWKSMPFSFSLIIVGTTEKELQFIMPLKLIYSKNLGLMGPKCIFEHYREVQTIKIY